MNTDYTGGNWYLVFFVSKTLCHSVLVTGISFLS